ncbi:MAG: amino acid permease [Bacteroidales bacterium]|nr:amino acid permease [Bacteroidales bacterium]MCK4638518.1 amino acid permease [Bacteroidales bacterium]
MNKIKSNKVTIGVFTLAMINVAAVLSLKNFPALAEYDFSLVFYLSLASLVFFIPSALVSAELASGWPQSGGVYLWVKEAFGPKLGFVAIFMQWVENLPWYPAAFAFVASAIAFIFEPSLAENKFFVIILIWACIWGATFLNFKGMKLSAFLSSSGVISGTIVPGIIIIVLGILYVTLGKPVSVDFSLNALIPDFSNINQIMLLAGMLMSIAGMEMSAVHIRDVDNPKKNYPKAIFIATVIIIVISVVASLSIAIVIPDRDLSLSAGVMQAFQDFFKVFNIQWATPILCFLLAYGVFTMAVTWMIGPSKGLLEVAKEGYLPRTWQKRNKYNMPVGILYVQAFFSTLLAVAVLFMPSVSSAFWLMSALAAQLYLIMYLFMFAAAIKLRYSKADVKRDYKIPGGKIGMWIVAGIAWLASFFVIVFGFIPPESVRNEGAGSIIGYIAFLLIGVTVFLSIPFIFFKVSKNKPGWKNIKENNS